MGKQNPNIRQGLAVAVILLFVGVAFAPSINANISKQDDLVEFDVEFYGLGQKHTVELTQQEAQKIELLFDDIEQRLSEVETREEAEEIFKYAIIQLDRYGFLGDLSVKQVQRLIIGNKLRHDIIERIGERYKNFPFINMNIFCFVFGHLTHSYSFGPVHYLLEKLGIDYDLTTFPFRILGLLMTIYFQELSPILYTLSPVNALKIVTAGAKHDSLHSPPSTSRSEGLILTIGLLGLKLWRGTNLIGSASDTPIFIYYGGPDGDNSNYYPAFIGFNGIKIITITDDYPYLKTYYLGFALKASLYNVNENQE